MHWFGGSIAEAVNLSKQKNAIFVVFIEGETDKSNAMSAMLDDATVLKRLSDQDNFLAVKLKSGSSDYTNFAQIYQLVPVPSLFFIGRNGVPLEVVCEGVQPSYLATRIDRILEQHYKDGQSTVHPSTSVSSIKEQTTSLLQAETSAAAKHNASEQEPESSAPQAKVPRTEQHEVTRSGVEYDVVCDGDVCTRKPRVANDPRPSRTGTEASEPQPIPAEESSVSIDEKMDRAKELIEAKRREKAEKEKEAERLKELERRAAGQGVAELKRWQDDEELKQIQEERKREKMENNLARQRVLEQIAQDRAERRARDNPRDNVTVAPTANVPATSGDATSRARVQFKLPDGSSHTAHFDSDRTLGDVRQYVNDNLQMSDSSFTLWTAFPRRELVENDATLLSLQLAPSAALLIMQTRRPIVVQNTGLTNVIAFLTHIFTSIILEPSQQLYNWVRSRLFPPTIGGNTPPAPSTEGQRGTTPPGVRRRGNVHRLPGEMAGDDDNNTWNGNSTQQM